LVGGETLDGVDCCVAAARVRLAHMGGGEGGVLRWSFGGLSGLTFRVGAGGLRRRNGTRLHSRDFIDRSRISQFLHGTKIT
jgi:hypothetical protein